MNIVNPSNGEVIREFSLATSDEVKAAVAQARSAFDQGLWTKLSKAGRKQFILKISQGILDKAAELAEIETLNTGKPIKETTFMDIPSAAKAFEFMANNFEKYFSEEPLDIDGQAQARFASGGKWGGGGSRSSGHRNRPFDRSARRDDCATRTLSCTGSAPGVQ